MIRRSVLALITAACGLRMECKGCGRDFGSEHALVVHQRMTVCKRIVRGELIIEEQPSSSGGSAMLPHDNVLNHRAKERMNEALALTTTMRIEKLVPAVHVQHFKDKLQDGALPLMRHHLRLELGPHITCSEEMLDDILLRCTNIFAGMETAPKERSKLLSMDGMEIITPRRRVLGVRPKDDDSSGATVTDVCWDLPAHLTLDRLFRRAPRAREQILAFQERMHLRAHQPQEGETICYVDLCDGRVYRDHPILGDEARRMRPTHVLEQDPDDPNKSKLAPVRLALSIVVYYDDVEPANSLGYARVIHKLGCFYMAVVDLGPSMRTNIHFILPFTLCLAKDVGRYGKKVLVGDPDSPSYAKCTCLGATLKHRLSTSSPDASAFEMVVHGELKTLPVDVSVLAVLADYPASASLGPWPRSTSARFFDRRTWLDGNDPRMVGPSSYCDGNADLEQCWELRTLEQLRECQVEFDQISRDAGKTAAEEHLRSNGINVAWNFDYAIRHFENVNDVELTPQDAMHAYLSSGIVGTETAAFLHQSHHIGAFTMDRFNGALKRRGLIAGVRIPPVYDSVTQGQKGGIPSSDARLQWSASQTLHFMSEAVSIFTPLVLGGIAAVEQLILAASTPAKRLALERRLLDYRRAWDSYCALAAVVDSVFAYQFTPDGILQCDRLTYRHHEKFCKVEAYMKANLWKPKQNFTQLIPFEIYLFGPPRGTYVMMFEMMNQVMKRFAASGQFSDVAFTAANLWDISSAWYLLTGSSSGFAATVPIASGPEIEVLRDQCLDRMHAYLFLHAFPSLQAIELSEVYEASYFNQQYALGTWVLAETWETFLSSESTATLAIVDRMVSAVAPGELFVQLVSFPDLAVADCWTSETTLVVRTESLQQGRREPSVHQIESLALTILNVTGTSSSNATEFRVQRTALG